MPYGQEYLGYGGAASLPAMQIDPLKFGAEDSLLTSQSQEAALRQQQASSLAPYALAAEKQEIQQKQGTSQAAYGNAMLAQVAREASAAPDSPTASKIWDQGMQKLASTGVDTASQYVGHYSDDLADRVSTTFGGQPAQGARAAATGGADRQALYQQLSQYPPAQLQQTVKLQNAIITAFNGVHDEPSWNAAIANLKMQGVPVDKMLGSTQWNPLTYAAVNRQIKDYMVPTRDAAQTLLLNQASGVSTPMVPNQIKEVNGQLYSVDPYGRSATPLTKKFEYLGPDKTGYGAAQVFDPTTGQLKPAGAVASLDTYSDFASKMNGVENQTGNPGAQNPRSTATGNGQFINATWLQQARQTFPAQTQGMSDQQILALRSNPQISQQVTAQYAAENAQALQTAGMPVTYGTLALAHRFGPDGALKLLESPADKPLADIFPSSVINANPDMKNATAGSYARNLIAQVGNQEVVTPTGQAAAVPGDSRLSGDAYLKSIPDSSIAAQIRAYDEGRIQQPSSFFMKTPYGQMMMRAIAQYDPGFDLTLYNGRVAAQTDLAKGKMGQNVTSFNTAIGHLGVLDDSVNRLENTPFPFWNKGVNVWRQETGDPRIQQFNVARNAVSDELTRAFRGTGGNVADIDAWKENLDAANSPQQLHGAVQQAVNLLDSRIAAVNDQYSRAMRLKTDPGSLLSPTARATLARLGGQTAQGQSGGGTPVRVQSVDQAMALPPGTQFMTPDGRLKVR